jgi:hypothetical protein
MNWIDIMKFLSQFDMKEVSKLAKEVKDVVAVVEKLKAPGGTKKETVELLRELSQALNATADVLD